jgi:serine-type D-Ala-D-Ala carboxypeptidase/endopeptidase (penicillin-binding protein 4)
MRLPTARLLRPLLVLIAFGGCAPVMAGPGAITTTPLAAELDALFDDPWAAHGHWGVLVRSLDTGETLYARNPDRLFVPASNVKLFTGAAVLQTLGPDFRYTTTIAGAGPIRNGVLEGPLVVTGTGDPTFSGRFFDEPRDAFRAWADSLRAHGVTRIAGGIIGVDTAFLDPTLGSGWAWDDLTAGYAAEFGPLQFNEGTVELDLFPSRTELQPALIIITPPTQAVRVINDTRTMPAGSVTALRILHDELGTGIILRGQVAADAEAQRRLVAVGNPTHFFVSILRETLREVGITVEGPALRHTELEATDLTVRDAIPLFTHSSPSLNEILTGMMKPSQNAIAETMLRTVGREMRGQGTAAAGAMVVDSLLTDWQIGDARLRLADGSGLSRYNLTSPELVVALLARMDESVYRDVWIESLPLAGRDGTLAGRMRDPPLIEQVRAKTGTLTGVRALSGYLTTRSGERIVFSTFINNHMMTAADIDRVVEAALERIATSR